MRLSELQKYKKILLIGYGTEGKATHEFLKKYVPDAIIGIADRKTSENYLDLQKDYDLAIKSPGIHKAKVIIPYTTATNIFFANTQGVTIGITGSKGKSTTSSLIHTMLTAAGKQAFLVGNITHKNDAIGTPMLAALMESNTKSDYWIVELSSFMLDDILYSPHISVFTSVFPEHMDYHGSFEKYFQAKTHIISQATAKDYFVYNPKFEQLRTLAHASKAEPIPYVQTVPFTITTSLIGEHNEDNIKGAVTVGDLLHIPGAIMQKALKQFIPLPHRLEKVGTLKGITFYDDAIATTPQATIEAIKALPTIATIFLGGQDRGYNFEELARTIADSDIENLVLFPTSGEKIFEQIIKQTNKQYTLLRTDNMDEAVHFAYANTPKNTICILSTASPSYTVWKNFEEKGDLFKKFVKKFGQPL